MGCDACERLKARLVGRERALAAATALMNMGAPHMNSEEQIRLRARAQDAKVDVELAQMELEQHERSHLREKAAGNPA